MNKTNFKVVIPARYASSRLPGKPLRLIAGKPMIQHTYERAIQSQASEVCIATDDQRIIDVVSQFTDNFIMTSAEHSSGTERLAEVLALKNWSEESIVVNVQGDEPLVLPAHINLVAQALTNNELPSMATLATPITAVEELFNTNSVKVVMDYRGHALYFSRAVMPWARDAFAEASVFGGGKALSQVPENSSWFRHIGMYAYRGSALKHYMTLAPCMLEKTESLEQLRLLYNGIAIHVSIITDEPGHGVDIEEDIAKVEALLRSSV